MGAFHFPFNTDRVCVDVQYSWGRGGKRETNMKPSHVWGISQQLKPQNRQEKKKQVRGFLRRCVRPYTFTRFAYVTYVQWRRRRLYALNTKPKAIPKWKEKKKKKRTEACLGPELHKLLTSSSMLHKSIKFNRTDTVTLKQVKHNIHKYTFKA